MASRHPTLLSGRDTGHVPFRIDGIIGRRSGVPLVMFMFYHVLTVRTPIGLKMRPKLLHHAGPVVRVKPRDIAAAGIERVPKVVGVRHGHPVLEDQRIIEVANVIWCTGFRPDFSWIDLPALGDDKIEPVHRRGIVANQPGLTSSACSFSMRPRLDWSVAWRGTPSTSSEPSRPGPAETDLHVATIRALTRLRQPRTQIRKREPQTCHEGQQQHLVEICGATVRGGQTTRW